MDFETIFYDALAVLNIILFTIISKLAALTSTGINYINEHAINPNNESLGIWAVLTYSKIKNSVINQNKQLEEKYPFIREFNEYAWYSICYIYSLIINIRIEPKAPRWISVNALYKLTGGDELNDNLMLDETVNLLPSIEYISDELKNDDLLLHMNQWIDAVHNLCDNNVLKEVLIILKYDNDYIYKICNKDMLQQLKSVKFEESNVRFLTIEYSYPGISNPIVIDVDKNAYLTGNDILSSSFIKRFFEYNIGIEQDLFQSEYVLKIMDNNLDNFELKSDQYITLHTDSYQIKNM